MNKRILFSGRPSLRSLTILGICLLACTSACKKDGQPPQPVVISSISPATGAFGTIVTITGSGFNANASGDSVKFNGVGALVQNASDTLLIVEVPKAAGTGPVTVQSGGQSGTGPVFNFIYTITVSTLAGSGTPGFTDGNGSTAQFNSPSGVATDVQGNIYVADYNNNRIRKITQAGVVSTLAGSGTAGFADGNGSTAQFNGPFGIATDTHGNIYVADFVNQRIRKISPAGVVSTLAGSTPGFTDGSGISAQFSYPTGVAADGQGNIYVADSFNQRIRKISPAGVVSTLAGSIYGFADGNGSTAQFKYPEGVATDVQGNIYVGDQTNNRIRKITPAGDVSTFAGSTQGFADGNGTSAKFYAPLGVATDARGDIYVADSFNQRIRKISPAGEVITLAGTAAGGFADGSGSAAEFNAPAGVATDAQGNKIYVADTQNNRIRLITIQ